MAHIYSDLKVQFMYVCIWVQYSIYVVYGCSVVLYVVYGYSVVLYVVYRCVQNYDVPSNATILFLRKST